LEGQISAPERPARLERCAAVPGQAQVAIDRDLHDHGSVPKTDVADSPDLDTGQADAIAPLEAAGIGQLNH
jgi:hypothetical protein